MQDFFESQSGIRYVAHNFRHLLFDHATAYTMDAFEEVAENVEFIQWEVDQLICVIFADKLKAIPEEKVYEAPMRWINCQDTSNINDNRKIKIEFWILYCH